MSIDHQKGNIVFMCDAEGCIEYLEAETGNWESALNVMRRERWRSSKATGEWKHYCPGCAAAIMGQG
jgi:hypothetical protein